MREMNAVEYKCGNVCNVKLSIAKLFNSGLERSRSCPGFSRMITCAGGHVTVRVV